jgi:uncharacterized protein YraI
MMRNNKFSHLKLILAFMLACVVTVGTFAQTAGDSLVRFVHVLPGASAIDVYIDDTLAYQNLAFGQATNYIQVLSGAQNITVTQSGAAIPLWTQEFAPGQGQAYSLIVSSLDDLSFTEFPDDLSPLPLGRSRITAIHAIPDAPTVDVVLADERAVVPGLEYNQPYGTLDIPALVYEMAVVPAGENISNAVIGATPFSLNSSTSYVIVAYGTLSVPQVLVLSAPTNAETGSGLLRIVHGVPGAPDVDVFANDILIAPSLPYGVASEYLSLPGDSYSVTLRAAGTDDIVGSGRLEVESDTRATAFAFMGEDGIEIAAFTDPTGDVTTTQSTVALFNLAQDAQPTISDADGNTLVEGVASGEIASASVGIASGTLNAQIDANAPSTSLNGQSGVTYGGVYYSAAVVDGDDGAQVIALPPISIAQGIASAPASAAPQVVAAPPTPTIIPIEQLTAAPQATPEPQVVVAAPTSVPPVQPTAAPTGPTARVILDPNANLQLRQFPSRDAFSLGLAPAGTILIVNGRQGEPVIVLPSGEEATATAPPDITPTIDPISTLAPDQDLIAAETWLNVTYNTPDGGSIDAWVNAQFLDVRDARDRLQRLADLPTVPANRAGESRDTAVGSPALPANIITATVFNLDAGVNLQVRRTPSVSAESLALVPNGTALELVGVNETQEWGFVRYNQPEGGVVTGWANTTYLSYAFQGIETTLETLDTQGRLQIIPDDERGEFLAGAAGPIAPTADPLEDVIVGEVTLNDNANLQLRRTPNANSESLGLIPSGSRVEVTGRTDVGDWVEVTFEGVTGWSASQFMSYTFNGAPYNLQDIPITITTLPVLVTPTATPAA